MTVCDKCGREGVVEGLCFALLPDGAETRRCLGQLGQLGDASVRGVRFVVTDEPLVFVFTDAQGALDAIWAGSSGAVCRKAPYWEVVPSWQLAKEANSS